MIRPGNENSSVAWAPKIEFEYPATSYEEVHST